MEDPEELEIKGEFHEEKCPRKMEEIEELDIKGEFAPESPTEFPEEAIEDLVHCPHCSFSAYKCSIYSNIYFSEAS